MSQYVLDRACRVEESAGVARYRAVVFGADADGCQYPDAANADGVVGITTHAQSREGKSVTVRRLGIAVCEAAAAIAVGDRVVVADNQGRVKRATHANVSTGSAGSNNGIVWTHRQPGPGGNVVGVQIQNAGASQALSVALADNTVRITAATNGGGAITSTAQQIIDAVNADAVASRILRASHLAGSNGTGVAAAVAATPLRGGEAGLNTIGIAQTAAANAGELVDVMLSIA